MAETRKQTVLPRRLAGKARAATPGSEQRKGDVIPNRSEYLRFESVRTLREAGRIVEAARKMARIDGTVSSAVYALVQVANSGFTVTAYRSGTHELFPEATNLARSIRASMDTLYDYTRGYADKNTFQDLVESGLREVVLTGAVCGELVLDRNRLPDRINLIAYEQLRWKANGKGGRYPVQIASGGEVDLNIPNFWVCESHREASDAYARTMLEASLNMAFYYLEFIEDMRRVMRRAGHSRLLVKLDAERVRAAAPSEVAGDEQKMKEFMEKVRADVELVVNALEPEDAFIFYDTVEVDALETSGEKQDYKDLLNTLSGILATSLKSHPSILGLRISGSQSLSNTESLIFLKIAAAIQKPVEKLLSRALTLAVRLYGMDAYVRFRFKDIDIRPESELEAFKLMRQDRILEQLSLGLITDDEAAELLETGVRPVGAPTLSGTFFHENRSNLADKVSPNQDPQGRALQPDTPNKGGGRSQ